MCLLGTNKSTVIFVFHFAANAGDVEIHFCYDRTTATDAEKRKYSTAVDNINSSKTKW